MQCVILFGECAFICNNTLFCGLVKRSSLACIDSLRKKQVMVTGQQKRIHKQFLRRQKVYENRYARLLLAVLAKQYNRSAMDYANGGDGLRVISAEDYETVYEKIYTTCMVAEAQNAWNMYVKPLGGEQKDIIDDLTNFLSQGLDESGLIKLWRRLSSDYIQVSIMTRLREVADTTRKAIRKVIEKGIQEGLGAEQISKNIRKESKGEINKNRSRLIARTEVVNAMNKGKRLSVLSSNLLWDKKWIATADDRTRMPHAHMNREGYFPLEQAYFVNGESLMYPGDPSGSAGNVCNCRCSEIYRVRRDASGRPLRKREIT